MAKGRKISELTAATEVFSTDELTFYRPSEGTGPDANQRADLTVVSTLLAAATAAKPNTLAAATDLDTVSR